MPAPAAAREGLSALLREATSSVPVLGLGVAQLQDAERVSLTYADAFGELEYRYALDSIPIAIRPPSAAPGRLTPADLESSPRGPLEARLLLTGWPDEIRRGFAVGQAACLPLPDLEPPGVLLIGLKEPDPAKLVPLASLEPLAARASEWLRRGESAAAELERLRRLEAVDLLLPELFHVLDVRWIFDRVSVLTSDVLPHDILGLYSEDLTKLEVYAHPSETGMPDIGPTRYPVSIVEPWTYHIIDDLTAHPVERDLPLTRAGGRSSLRVPLRLDGAMLGALNFTSLAPVGYTTADVAVARRIGDYVALAMAHQRLAEAARQVEELRARTASSELLDDLLAALTDTGELPDVFEKISAIAKKVLPHDALALPVLLPDGRHARVYASAGALSPQVVAPPEVVELPEAILAQRHDEFVVIPDLQADPVHRDMPPTKLGFRSSLRIPIHLDGKVAGALDFLALAPSRYKESDVPVARRIADRLALSLSRERRREASARADEAVARAARLESRVKALTEELNARAGFRRVIGDSLSWRQVLTQATQVAPTESTVLLLGESGTGKEVVARFVHGGSPRHDGPFVALNCAALPEQLLEAELFGYERGAFTGATQSKPGQLEMAQGGTLFLDEVGEMSLPAQAKFLRVLQEREFQRLGGTRVLKTDARVVAATNRDLLRAIERGQFREDLYYRLNVFSIQLPPLRERKEDVLVLSDAFIGELGKLLGRPPAGISKEARQALLGYHWPGNVRELRNVLERAAILCDGGLIAAEHLALRPVSGAAPPPPPAASSAPAAQPASPPAGDLNASERAMIEKALQDAQFNKSVAAKRLGITRAQLYVRLRRHGLE